MKKLYLLLFILFCYNANAQWKYANYPYGGYVNSIAATKTAVAVQMQDLFVSTTNGDHWNRNSNSLLDYSYELCATNDKLFVVTSFGIYASSDNGNTWQPSGNGIPDTVKINVLSADGNQIFAGAMDRILFKSIDNGVSWHRIDIESRPNDYFQNIVVQKNMVLASGSSDFSMSTDGGDTWVDSIPTLPESAADAMVIAGKKIITCFFSDFYVSEDKGSTWKFMDTNLPFNVIGTAMAYDDSVIYLGTADGVFISKDGENYTKIFAGVPDHCLVLNLTVTNTGVFLGTNKDLFFSSDHGNKWVKKSNGLDNAFVWDILVTGNEILTTGGLGVVASNDDAVTWKEKNDKLVFETNGRKLVEVDSMIVLGCGAGIYTSVDKGENWAIRNQGLPFWPSIFDLEVKGGKIYAALAFMGLYKSTDRCKSWTSAIGNLPANSVISNVGSHNATIFITVGYDNEIYKSVQGDDNWVLANNGIPSNVQPFDFITIGDVVFVETNKGVYKTTDDGMNWTLVKAIPEEYISHLSYFAGMLWIAAEEEFLVSNDLGENCRSVKTGLPQTSIFSLKLKDNGVYAGTRNGLWYRPLSEVVSGINENKQQPEISLYPNPGNGVFYINTTSYTNLHIEVYNLLGEKVHVSDLNTSSPLDLSNLTKGIYSLSVTKNNQLYAAKKIVIQ